MRDYLPFPAMGKQDNLNLGGTTKALRLSSLQWEERRFLLLFRFAYVDVGRWRNDHHVYRIESRG